MISDFIEQKIHSFLPFKANDSQKKLIHALSEFLFLKDSRSVFLLKGYAGTGKSSIVGALVKTIRSLDQKCILLAPTGRAAKVVSNYSNEPAFTIHKKIYQQKSITQNVFQLAANLHKDTFFIVDEASMIANFSENNSIFGSGCLLDDLIQYVYNGENCRIIFVGDDAQLPPIGQNESPALQRDWLEGYMLKVYDFTLTEVARQSLNSGILKNATNIRTLIREESPISLPLIELENFSDIHRVNGNELIDALQTAYNQEGIENVMVITHSNFQASIYNKGIRNQILQREGEIESGDMIIVTKNNYFWGKDYEGFDFIANGDIAEIIRVKKHYEMYGLRFADVYIRMLDYDYELEARILLDLLHADKQEENSKIVHSLYENVALDYEDISNKQERMKQMRNNPFFNALQVKFAYAVTCHKAQGGQWENVFIDQGLLSKEQPENYYHWFYTSVTRATKELYLINLPKQCYGENSNF